MPKDQEDTREPDPRNGPVSSVRDPDPLWKADPCQYHVKSSPDALKMKTKVLDTYNTNKNCFNNIYVE